MGRRRTEEEGTLAEENLRNRHFPPTHYLDDMGKAAERLGSERAMIRYQINAYAEPNNFCHSGIKAMVEKGDFQELREQIMEDSNVCFRSGLTRRGKSDG